MDVTRMLGRLTAVRPGEQEEGQALVEYALIILFIALVVITGLSAFGGTLKVIYENIVGTLPF